MWHQQNWFGFQAGGQRNNVNPLHSPWCVHIFPWKRFVLLAQPPTANRVESRSPHTACMWVCVCVLSFKCCIPSAFSSQSVQSLLLLSHNQTPTIILSSSTSVTLASIKLVSVNGLFIIQGWLNSIKPISIKLLSIKHTIIRLTSVYLPPGNLSLSN